MSTLQHYRLLLAAMACLPLTACSPTFFHTPRLRGPGSAPYQQARAEVFDPYPPNDVAPEIVGGRPLDYQVPANEVTRSREFLGQTRASAQPVFVPTAGATFPAATAVPQVGTTAPAFVSPSPAFMPQPSASKAPPSKVRY